MRTYVPTAKMLQDIASPSRSRLESLVRGASERVAAAIFALLGYEEKKEEKKRQANRVVLPMSSGASIVPPNTSAQVISRPQNIAFRPERVVIGGTPRDWIVNDIRVGNRSQFAQAGDVPGEMFAATATDGAVLFDTVQNAQDFTMIVTYVGSEKEGAPFVCGVLGTAAT